MLDMGYELVVPGFKIKEIGPTTLVRTHPANFHLTLTNNDQKSLVNLSVRPVLESYVGQQTARLFQWSNTQVIEKIRPKGMLTLEFSVQPFFPGLVSVAIYVTDAANNVPMAKRITDTDYQQAPVRWWFHVVDNISVQTLRALRALVAEKQVGRKKK